MMRLQRNEECKAEVVSKLGLTVRLMTAKVKLSLTGFFSATEWTSHLRR